MIILGIDPGIATIGFGIVEAHRSQCRVIQYGVLSTPAGLPLSHRLTMIYEDMQELIHTPFIRTRWRWRSCFLIPI